MPDPAPDSRFESVVVMGAGYVGLPLCLHFAISGLKVVAVDIDEDVVSQINDRTRRIDEKEDFGKFFETGEVRLNLTARMSPVEADAFVIAVPTPVNHGDKSPDLRAVVAASEAIIPFLRPGNLVIVESTVPPLTTKDVVGPILERSGFRVGREIHLAHCPERVLPGNVMAEAIYNARVVGGVDAESTELAARLFRTFVKGELLLTNDRTAEFVKLIENSYRDVNVAFSNQVSMLGDRLGIDPWEAIDLANRHPRVAILNPGIGVGGHCIPVDPWFLVDACPDSTDLLRAARRLNDGMPGIVAAKILASVRGIEEAKIVCIGATYKPNVRDARESPALEVVRILREAGANVALFDPLLADMGLSSVLSAARGADALAVLVPHDPVIAEIRHRREEILASMRTRNLLVFGQRWEGI